jgi:hypothetical protein
MLPDLCEFGMEGGEQKGIYLTVRVARFLFVKYQNGGKIYQMTTKLPKFSKYTKLL